jgi:outer membrane protein assembly factor BamB
VAAAWDTLWTRGGEADDTLLLMPWAMAADSGRVYVLDAAAHRLVALDAADGSVAWVAGSKGSGPGEFQSPTAVAALPGGRVAVADPQNNRITILGDGGFVSRTISSRDASDVTSLCGLSDGSLVIATLADTQPVLTMSPDGRVTGRYDLPWPDVAARPPITRAAKLVSAGGPACVLLLTLGRGFATFEGGRFTQRREYVERLELPHAEVTQTLRSRTQRLVERQIAAYDGAVDGGEIALAFEGRTADARRIIDVYELSTGTYLRSYRLPYPANGLARFGGRYYLLAERDGYPVLTALSLVPDVTPPAQEAAERAVR